MLTVKDRHKVDYFITGPRKEADMATTACYLTLINASSGYHNLKLQKRSSYLPTFTFHFAGTGMYKGLPFGAATEVTC